MSMFQYGKITPVRAIEPPNKVSNHDSYRTAEIAIRQKIKVLKDFYVIDETDPRSEILMREKLEKAVAAEPDKHFDLVLDRLARDLIRDKLGG